LVGDQAAYYCSCAKAGQRTVTVMVIIAGKGRNCASKRHRRCDGNCSDLRHFASFHDAPAAKEMLKGGWFRPGQSKSLVGKDLVAAFGPARLDVTKKPA
jgi:hypothetical protein